MSNYPGLCCSKRQWRWQWL